MAKSSCKCKEVECEECPEWIFTLADLIMCMMGLFVILWVLKPSPTKNEPYDNPEMVKTVAAIRTAFGYVPNPQSNDPIDIELMMNQAGRIQPTAGPGEHGNVNRKVPGAEGTDQEVQTIRTGPQSVAGGKVLFEAGQVNLSADGMRVLDQIALQIKGHRNIAMVKGHTSADDFGEGSGAQQKMDLSLRRAQAAADYLVRKGVEPDILRVQGCSTFEPVVQRDYTPQAYRINRRVEVEVTATLVEELQDHARSNDSVIGTGTSPAPLREPAKPGGHK